MAEEANSTASADWTMKVRIVPSLLEMDRFMSGSIQFKLVNESEEVLISKSYGDESAQVAPYIYEMNRIFADRDKFVNFWVVPTKTPRLAGQKAKLKIELLPRNNITTLRNLQNAFRNAERPPYSLSMEVIFVDKPSDLSIGIRKVKDRRERAKRAKSIESNPKTPNGAVMSNRMDKIICKERKALGYKDELEMQLIRFNSMRLLELIMKGSISVHEILSDLDENIDEYGENGKMIYSVLETLYPEEVTSYEQHEDDDTVADCKDGKNRRWVAVVCSVALAGFDISTTEMTGRKAEICKTEIRFTGTTDAMRATTLSALQIPAQIDQGCYTARNISMQDLRQLMPTLDQHERNHKDGHAVQASMSAPTLLSILPMSSVPSSSTASILRSKTTAAGRAGDASVYNLMCPEGCVDKNGNPMLFNQRNLISHLSNHGKTLESLGLVFGCIRCGLYNRSAYSPHQKTSCSEEIKVRKLDGERVCANFDEVFSLITDRDECPEGNSNRMNLIVNRSNVNDALGLMLYAAFRGLRTCVVAVEGRKEWRFDVPLPFATIEKSTITGLESIIDLIRIQCNDRSLDVLMEKNKMKFIDEKIGTNLQDIENSFPRTEKFFNGDAFGYNDLITFMAINKFLKFNGGTGQKAITNYTRVNEWYSLIMDSHEMQAVRGIISRISEDQSHAPKN